MSNIRWSDKDDNELKRLVRNFNAKVRRLEEKEPYLVEQRPERVKVKDIRDNITTRQDLNRQLRSLERFTKRGVENLRELDSGVITTQWQYKEASIMQRVITRKRRDRREGVEGFRRIETENLLDKPKPDKVSPQSFDKYIKSLEREIKSSYDLERQKMFLENYIRSVNEELGMYGKPIINYIKTIPLQVFVKNAITNPYLSIDFIYGEESKEEIAEYILEEWQRVT